ncbi:hypothetical protein Tco_0253004 [Tanacetum coccineum]
MGYSFYSPSENKVFVARNAEFFESKLLDLKASGSVEDLELIQEEDTNPSVETSLNHEEDDQEIDEPQSDINPIRRSTRTRRPTDRLCLYIDTEEHETLEPIRIFIAIARTMNMVIMAMDVKTAFLNDIFLRSLYGATYLGDAAYNSGIQDLQ